MPCLIKIGVVNINTPQQNSSVFIGEAIVTGMDANMKVNSGHGGTFGFHNVIINQHSFNIDGMEAADGNMNDQNIKSISAGGNI